VIGPDPAFDAPHPSGHILFRSTRGGYLDSVILTEGALRTDAASLAEAITRAGQVSHLMAVLAVREEITAAGHTPSDELPTPDHLATAREHLMEHRLNRAERRG
jgi:hypothetical protein